MDKKHDKMHHAAPHADHKKHARPHGAHASHNPARPATGNKTGFKMTQGLSSSNLKVLQDMYDRMGGKKPQAHQPSSHHSDPKKHS
jgi:hypothetical protein